MATQITAVTFDVGGVLVDWNPRHLYRELFRGDEAAMERFLAEVVDHDWNARLDAGYPFAQAVAELSVAHPDRAEMIAAYHDRWLDMLGGSFDGTVAIMRELRSAGVPVYGLSNWTASSSRATPESGSPTRPSSASS